MWDLRKALGQIDGKVYPTVNRNKELRRDLGDIVWLHRHDLPTDFCTEDLLMLIRRSDYLYVVGTDKLKIDVY